MDDVIGDIARMAGNENIPVILMKNIGNAFYVPPNKEITSGRSELSKRISQLSNTGKGGVISDLALADPTVIAHEIGHSRNPGATGLKIDEFWDSYGLPILGTIGAVGAGIVFPQYKNTAALVNLGIQALSMAPSLLNEYQASSEASKIYPKADKELLNSMLQSHAINTLKKRMLIPGLVHGLNFLEGVIK